MTRILVLSDTHLSQGIGSDGTRFDLLERLKEHLDAADLILHAGDHTGVSFHRALNLAGELISVAGNMDDSTLGWELPERTVVEREGVRIGIMHGWGPPQGLADRVYNAWFNEKPDIIIFGHSHHLHLSRRGQVLLLNPGSATEARRGGSPSVGWLEIEDREIQAKHILLPKPSRFLRPSR
ncbi:MAG: metallophosphoesterase family protein [bacterium]|nr:metallophosphoesterase family protein [bacterium]